MFSADVTWADPDVEKVGQRRERKARERATNASACPSTNASRSSRSSVASNDRETFWPARLKKAKLLKPGAWANSDAERDAVHQRKTSSGSSKPFELTWPLKDPALHPDCTYSSSLGPTMPSGAPLDPPGYESPRSGVDHRQRSRANSGSIHSANNPSPHCKPTPRVQDIDKVHKIQQLRPKSFVARTTATRIETGHREPQSILTYSFVKGPGDSADFNTRIEPDVLTIDDHSVEGVLPRPSNDWPLGNGMSEPAAWNAPPDWHILPNEPDGENDIPEIPHDVANEESEVPHLTRFALFIRRMQNAGTEKLIERLKEEWPGPASGEPDEQWKLEKKLWLLTAFQILNAKNSGVIQPSSPSLPGGQKTILELYGNLAEVYQLAAMYPGSQIHYLSTTSHPPKLPAHVTFSHSSKAGSTPLPYTTNTFSHIRASTLPTFVPSAKLPQMLKECHRLLAVGGMLEIRIMDASPVRRTAGPKMRAWIEDRVALNLERLFRCSKPCLLVPNWVKDAGFELRRDTESATRMMRMPCAANPETGGDADEKLAALVARALWMDIWGGFVADEPREARWWWEDQGVMEECREYGTVFECGALVAVKR